MRTFRADDPDARFEIPITAKTGDLLWSNPTVTVDGTAVTITATWLGSPGSTRTLQVPLASLMADYAGCMLFLRLVVPGDTDVDLGYIVIET